ncbi:CpsD/CapB family tyrosine-protein kinase [Ammoniphilus sp. YIM 78166]|uniref:CpsD/CapB family tyrosine-protein kinase n=1 Tax=Ammoniphilus sp. YIM 78166 TaxID=1644106 RepID=UPI001F0E1DB2|nr:CpsD/CapB family tyrosine-protein kinase [Ammoniphilus sp. YIM 78166]
MLLKIKKHLISYSSPHSQIAEQYRMIRTNLEFVSMDEKEKIIVITSPNSGDGKTTTVSNLAISMAQKGERVLLVDADLRNPALHKMFDLHNEVGLTTLLTQFIEIEDAAQPTDIDQLKVLTSGPYQPNPTELLGSNEMKRWMNSARKQFDRILFDTSSVLDVTDARVVANQSDGAILVIRSGKTDIFRALEAKRLLDLARVKVKGVILNQK